MFTLPTCSIFNSIIPSYYVGTNPLSAANSSEFPPPPPTHLLFYHSQDIRFYHEKETRSGTGVKSSIGRWRSGMSESLHVSCNRRRRNILLGTGVGARILLQRRSQSHSKFCRFCIPTSDTITKWDQTWQRFMWQKNKRTFIEKKSFKNQSLVRKK